MLCFQCRLGTCSLAFCHYYACRGAKDTLPAKNLCPMFLTVRRTRQFATLNSEPEFHRRYPAEQFFRPVSAILAISHFPLVRIRLNRSVPQWSTLPSSRNSNG